MRRRVNGDMGYSRTIKPTVNLNRAESYNGFGEKGEDFTFIPNGYSLCKNRLLNTEYRLENMPVELKSKFANHLKRRIEKLEKEVDNPTDIAVMIKAPFVLDPGKAKKI